MTEIARIRECSNEQYHSDVDVLSSSMLKHALESPAAYIQSLLNSHRRTRSMDLGTLIHALVLEPIEVQKLVAIYPTSLTLHKECKDFKEANKNRFCISMSEFIGARTMANKILESKYKGRAFYLFVEEGVSEESIYYTDPTTGLQCRTRLDLKHPEITFDLKTTAYSDVGRFAIQAEKLHYDLSAYMYSYARLLLETSLNPNDESKPKPFVVVAACTDAPHSVHFMPASVDFLNNGRKKYQYALSIIHSCSKVHAWPSMGGEVELTINHWNSFSPPSIQSLSI